MARQYNADGVEYTLTEVMTATSNQSYWTVTKFRSDLDKAHIRKEVQGIPVTEIAEEAAYQHEYLKEIYIPESVDFIGKFAFAYCSELEYVHFVNSGEDVVLDFEAFSGCENLIMLFGNRLLYIYGERVFQGCKKLQIIPNISGGIPDSSFFECRKLHNVYITDENRFVYISASGLKKCSLKTITVFGKMSIHEDAIKDLTKHNIAIIASDLDAVADLAYEGVFVKKIGDK